MSDSIDTAERADTTRGNWLLRNDWLLKGLAGVGVLVGFAYASLFFLEQELSMVLWAIGITLAALLGVAEIAIGAMQALDAT